MKAPATSNHAARGAAVAAVVLVAWAAFAWAAIDSRDAALERSRIALTRPIEDPSGGYVSSNACPSCHPHEYAMWSASYHPKMTQLATPETVVGDFDGTELELDGLRYTLGHDGDSFWVELDEHAGTPRARRVRRPIVMTTGSHHDQKYWHTTIGGGRDVKMIPFQYSIRDGRWVPVRTSFLMPPEELMPMKAGAWNFNCALCHSTAPEPRAVASGAVIRADTRVAEFGIACEACHGPAAGHVGANRDPRRRYRLHFEESSDASVVNPARLDHERSAEVCGQCHGIWVTADGTGRFLPGDRLADHGTVTRRAPGPRDDPGTWRYSFWSDGMVRVSGREYNGLLESPCFQRGEMSCVSCHVLHKPSWDDRSEKEWANDQLALGMDTNLACVQCHGEYDGPEALAAHTHHEPESSGSLCYNCHMPHTTYGLQKAIRSHEVSSPSAAESLETGRPNACNACHLDRSLAWTSQHASDWWGLGGVELAADERDVAASVLWALRGDAGQRALAAWYMGWAPAMEASGADWMVPYLVELLDDPYASVRMMALRSLRARPQFEGLEYDHTAPPAERQEAARGVLARCKPVAGGPVLAREDYERLLSQRDQTPVELHE